MEIKGFVDVSISDWDGKVSSVIFLPGCNFRCPFCYNKSLVLQPESMPTIAFERIEKYLETNKKWIDGVVLTGGEPTNHESLSLLSSKLKKMALPVKLDTNGTNPAMIRNLITHQLVDYVALDVKAPLTEEKYSRAAGINAASFLEKITETIQVLLENTVEYEFRTTMVPTVHEVEDVEGICHAIKGCRKYALQSFRSDVETINPCFQDLQPFSKGQMEAFLHTAKTIVPNTILRG